MTFKIPPGDHSVEHERYSELMRLAHLQAGRKRQKFIQYKKAVKRCHINTIESSQVRALLSQVRLSYFIKMRGLKFGSRDQNKIAKETKIKSLFSHPWISNELTSTTTRFGSGTT